jgi:hypothetical protein
MTRLSRPKPYDDEDDDAFERGVLKDGHKVRFSVSMMDSVQRDVAEHFERVRAKDAAAKRFGLSDGLAFNKPGFRHVVDDAALDAVEAAYAEIAARDENAWRNPDPQGVTGSGSHGFRGAQTGDECTIDGQAGHMKMIGGELKCVPDSTDALDARELAYRDCDEAAANAWRNPR